LDSRQRDGSYDEEGSWAEEEAAQTRHKGTGPLITKSTNLHQNPFIFSHSLLFQGKRRDEEEYGSGFLTKEERCKD
jgi:hypothetical protein